MFSGVFPSEKNGDGWLISSYDHIDMNNHSIDGWTFSGDFPHNKYYIGYSRMNNRTIRSSRLLCNVDDLWLSYNQAVMGWIFVMHSIVCPTRLRFITY